MSESNDDEETEKFVERESHNFIRQKRRRKEIDEPVEFLEDGGTRDRDDHEAFMVSLLPTLRTFSESQTLVFRAEVLRVVMELKNIIPSLYLPNTSNQSMNDPLSSTNTLSSSNNTTVFELCETQFDEPLSNNGHCGCNSSRTKDCK